MPGIANRKNRPDFWKIVQSAVRRNCYAGDPGALLTGSITSRAPVLSSPSLCPSRHVPEAVQPRGRPPVRERAHEDIARLRQDGVAADEV